MEPLAAPAAGGNNWYTAAAGAGYFFYKGLSETFDITSAARKNWQTPKMPYKQYYRKKRGTRRFRRKGAIFKKMPYRYNQFPTRNSSSKQFIMPARFTTKLKSSELATVTETDNQVYYLTVNLNSLFEPLEGSTVQPRGYDQFRLFYHRYHVYGCKVRLSVENISSTSKTIYFVDIITADTTVPDVADINNWVQHSANGVRLLADDNPTAAYERYVDLPKDLGISRAVYEGKPGYGAFFDASPSNQHRLRLAFSDPAGTGDLNFRYLLEVTQYVALSEKKRSVAESTTVATP